MPRSSTIRRLLLVPAVSLGLGALAAPAPALADDHAPRGKACGHASHGAPDWVPRPFGHGDGRKVH